MPNVPKDWPAAAGSTLLQQGLAIIDREGARMPNARNAFPAVSPFHEPLNRGATPLVPPGANHGGPVSAQALDPSSLTAKAGEVLGAIVGSLQGGARTAGTGTAPFFVPADKDQLRQQLHALVDSLLVTFRQSTGEEGVPNEESVPVVHAVGPVLAGGHARGVVRVANDETTSSEVSLYCSNFVTDRGYEIPPHRVRFSPRRVTIAPKSVANFDVQVEVAEQTPAGLYSGLVVAMGCRYVKAVLTFEVL